MNSTNTPAGEIAFLGDVPIEIEVELDRKVMTIEEILELDVGSVIRMSRSAGENIDILIGGALVGSGEIVIIEETVGVRMTDFNNEA
jgi:flagellar motor switch protein FliN/FliY